MHGLINRSIERFLIDCYGEDLWHRVARPCGIFRFESMLHYDDEVTTGLIEAASAILDKPGDVVLEDLGAHLVRFEPVRRLLRFGGNDFCEFLISLNELQDRGRLALPDLELPQLRVEGAAERGFDIGVRAPHPGWSRVLAGLLRAMADDYGALILLSDPERVEDNTCPDMAGKEMAYKDAQNRAAEICCARFHVELVQAQYAKGRRFELAGQS